MTLNLGEHLYLARFTLQRADVNGGALLPLAVLRGFEIYQPSHTTGVRLTFDMAELKNLNCVAVRK